MTIAPDRGTAYGQGMPDSRGTVLIVEDDAVLADVLSRYVASAGYSVELAGDGPAAVDAHRRVAPDLVVLDLMLPGFDGFEVCRRIRQETSTPVIMLTARGDESDRIAGLELGADDYIAKPFSPREVLLRIDAVLRRANASGSPASGRRVLRDGTLVLDTAAHAVELDGEPLALTSREYDLLVHLMTHPRTAFTREELLRDVWGWEIGDKSTVTVHVRRLREKLGDDAEAPTRVVTVWGVGYRYEPVSGP
jgi:DNA-binding response OmpR family regulator